MTLKILNQHLDLRRELAKTERLRESLRAAAEPGAQTLTGMPHAPGYKNKLGNLGPEIADLSREIEKIQVKLNEQEPEIIKFVNSILDRHIRTVFRLRFIHGLDWSEVARIVNGGNTASSVKSVCYRYLRKSCAALRRDAPS